MIIKKIKEKANTQVTTKAEFLVTFLETEGFKTKEEKINALQELGSNKILATHIISNTMIATGVKVLLERIFNNGKSTSVGKTYVTTAGVLSVASAVLLKKVTQEAINIINNK